MICIINLISNLIEIPSVPLLVLGLEFLTIFVTVFTSIGENEKVDILCFLKKTIITHSTIWNFTCKQVLNTAKIIV